MTHGKRAAFLDRDGTINVERGYVTRPEDLVLIDGAGAAVRSLNEAGLLVVLVSNQSGVARGLMSEDDLARVHERLEELLAEDCARFDGAYYCPNYPEGTEERFTRDTSCRKPETGMVEQASRDLGIDVASSFMIGDHATDIELAQRAGMEGVLVMTGKGPEKRSELARAGIPIAHVAHDLTGAVAWVLERVGGEARERGTND